MRGGGPEVRFAGDAREVGDVWDSGVAAALGTAAATNGSMVQEKAEREKSEYKAIDPGSLKSSLIVYP